MYIDHRWMGCDPWRRRAFTNMCPNHETKRNDENMLACGGRWTDSDATYCCMYLYVLDQFRRHIIYVLYSYIDRSLLASANLLPCIAWNIVLPVLGIYNCNKNSVQYVGNMPVVQYNSI